MPLKAEELSDDEIERLLEEAETRLRAAAGVQNHDSEDGVSETAATKERRKPLPRLKSNFKTKSYIHYRNGIAYADPTRLVDAEQRKLAAKPRAVENAQKKRKMNDQLSAGPQWFDMPKTVLDPQLKRDLQLIEMRSVLDPHRHFKKDDRKEKVPIFSQTGTVVEGPTEWYSSRINRKDRAKNFVEEAMKTDKETGRFKRKYGEIQDAKTSGKRAHYKSLMAKRKKKS